MKMRKRTWIMTTLLVGSSGWLLWGPESFLSMMASNFAVHYLAAIVLLSVYWLFRKRIFLGLMAIGCAVAVQGMLPPLWSDSGIDTAEADLRIAQFNVLKFNYHYDEVVADTRATEADFVAFIEVDSRWTDSLVKGLKDIYPYYRLEPHDYDCYGMAVFSRYPLSGLSTFYVHNMANISGVIQHPDSAVRFIAAHTKAPMDRSKFRLRNQHVRELAQKAGWGDRPGIVLGDFNSVPWDAVIREFKAETGLLDSRKSLTPTYPSWLPLGGIPIDFIFHSAHLNCLAFDRVKSTGSDHFGVVGAYQFRSLNRPKA